MTDDLPPLSARSGDLWRRLTARYDFSVPEREVLTRALQQEDLADRCAERIAEEGLMLGGKPHPLLAVQRDALQTAARWWRQLKFRSADERPTKLGRRPGTGWSPIRAGAPPWTPAGGHG